MASPKIIQVDIGGHPPFPTHWKYFSSNFGNLLFLAIFNFRGHLEGLNEGFSGSNFSMIAEVSDWSTEMNLVDDTFPMAYHATKTKIICKLMY
jgi:hypothetical protein